MSSREAGLGSRDVDRDRDGTGNAGVAGEGPRREGPTDLRLVPPALAVWAAAAVTLGLSGRWAVVVAVTCSALALVLLVASARAGRSHVGRAAGRSRVLVAGGAVLLCAAASAAVAGLHGADVRRGPVPGLAREHARIDAEVRVTSDPRPTRPAVRGNHSAPALLLINAEVLEVRTPDGPSTRVRTPVLLMVAAGDRRAEWQKLLPSTRLRLDGRLASGTRRRAARRGPAGGRCGGATDHRAPDMDPARGGRPACGAAGGDGRSGRGCACAAAGAGGRRHLPGPARTPRRLQSDRSDALAQRFRSESLHSALSSRRATGIGVERGTAWPGTRPRPAAGGPGRPACAVPGCAGSWSVMVDTLGVVTPSRLGPGASGRSP
ncbi:hypothetical protein SBADM41S_10085 [Streptomyces badius]